MKWVISIELFLGQSLVSINIHSPIGKLLVLINQSLTLFTNLSTELKKLIGIWYKIKYTELLSPIMKCSIFICEKKHVFIEENNPSSKAVTIEEELDAVKVDGIGNLVK